MDLQAAKESETRFEAYVQELASVIGHKDREKPLRDYSRGLLTASGRKSVEPLAAVTAPAEVAAQHQSLLHFVGKAPWPDSEVLTKVRELTLPVIEKRGPLEAWIIDDTGFPKKGKHSVGVARQYCGQLGKQDNCQNAVSLSIANHHASLPIGYRMYLPEEWANDEVRRKKAGVPADVTFQTKPEIALELLKQARSAGVPRGMVLADAGYGADTKFRDEVTAMGFQYAMGIGPGASVWAPGTAPLPPKEWTGKGRRPTRLRRDEEHQPVTVKALALSVPEEAWQIITWREGTDEWLKSRFARVRVRPAHRDYQLDEPRPEEWLLIEWPEDEAEPAKYWFSTMAASIAFGELVDATKLRWRIERDYRELKQEVGLGHFEGRSWRGFHHHATLCIAAYGFLISERETIPPSGPAFAARLKKPAISGGYRPRGAADPARTPCGELNCQPA
ncbi:MAG: IS701 family transposase [Rhodomicrobium sp.]